MHGRRGEVRVGGVSIGGHAPNPCSPLRKVPCLSTELGTLPDHRMAQRSDWVLTPLGPDNRSRVTGSAPPGGEIFYPGPASQPYVDVTST